MAELAWLLVHSWGQVNRIHGLGDTYELSENYTDRSRRVCSVWLRIQ